MPHRHTYRFFKFKIMSTIQLAAFYKDSSSVFMAASKVAFSTNTLFLSSSFKNSSK